MVFNSYAALGKPISPRSREMELVRSGVFNHHYDFTFFLALTFGTKVFIFFMRLFFTTWSE